MLRRVSLRKDRATCDLKYDLRLIVIYFYLTSSRLDNSCIFIPHTSNTEDHHVTGKLTVNLSQSTNLKSIKVRLRGLLRM